MSKRVLKTDIAKPYVEQYVNFPSLTLAKLIYSENKSSFKDVDAARTSVRILRGAKGDFNRKYSADKRFFDKEPRSNKSPFSLPETWAHPKTVFQLPVQCNNIGFISDHQVPFQDNAAIEACYSYLKDVGVNTIFINGDFIDFYGLSSFQKDPRRRDFNHEYYNILMALEHLRGNFPNATIYYNLDANHEARYEKFMMFKAPELLKLELPEHGLADLLRLSLHGIIPLHHNDHCLIGKLPVLHGHTIFTGQTSPVSTARTVYMKAKQSCIASHCHQVSEYTTKTLSGEIITCWTTGMLMDNNCEYNPHNNNYSQGFAHITTERDGSYHVGNKRIYDGKVL